MQSRRHNLQMRYHLDAALLVRDFKADPACALHSAVLHGDFPHIRNLLVFGFNIDQQQLAYRNRRFEKCGTALHVAIWFDQAAAFELLFVHGADLEVLDEGEYSRPTDTPIRLAVRLVRRAMFKRLWDARVDPDKYSPNMVGASNRSLIEVAAGEGQAEILGDLLDWKKDWTQDQRINALYMASKQ